MRKEIKYSLVFLFFGLFFVQSQNYNELIKKKEILFKEAKKLNTALEEAQKTHGHKLMELGIINLKIEKQEELLDLYQNELHELKKEELDAKNELSSVVKKLNNLKKNYATLIQITHKTNQSYNKMLFFLSSKNFNQLFRRFYHLRQLEINRRRQYFTIQTLQNEIEIKKKKITQKRAKQSDVTFEKKRELELLNKSRQLKKSIIDKLKTKEDSLLAAINIKNEQAKKIQQAIVVIIEKEKEKENKLTPESKLTSDQFASNKGSLPWPVSRGTVISRFGKVPHPLLSGITIENNGIEIATQNTNVRSVFNGEVTKIIILPTGRKVVIVRHGEYLTVYSNLNNVAVKKGQKIKTKETIGSLYDDKNKKNNILEFQIWQLRDKLNPTQWISSY